MFRTYLPLDSDVDDNLKGVVKLITRHYFLRMNFDYLVKIHNFTTVCTQLACCPPFDNNCFEGSLLNN